MKILPYKNRKLDLSKPVELYRCLNRKGFIFSLRQNGLVVGHTDKIVLKDCEFIVNQAGLKRVRQTGQRNVHAFVRGVIGTVDDIKNSFSFILNYSPAVGRFGNSTGMLDKCEVLYIQEKQVYCQ